MLELGVAGRFRDEPGLHERAWHWIAALDPDLAFLQETEPPFGRATVGNSWSGRTFSSPRPSSPSRDGTPLVILPACGVLERFNPTATAEIGLVVGMSLTVLSVHTSAHVAPDWGHPGSTEQPSRGQESGEPWWNDSHSPFTESSSQSPVHPGRAEHLAIPRRHGVPKVAGAEFFSRPRSSVGSTLADADGREGKTWYGSSSPRTSLQALTMSSSTPRRRLASDRSRSNRGRSPDLGLSDHAPLLLDLDLDAAVDPGNSRNCSGRVPCLTRRSTQGKARWRLDPCPGKSSRDDWPNGAREDGGRFVSDPFPARGRRWGARLRSVRALGRG